MFLFKTAEETHFQCPECGQRGAVPTEILEKAMQENEHVQISCTSCQAKFQPFDNLADKAKADEADADASADEQAAENLTGSIAEAVADLAETVHASENHPAQSEAKDDNEEINLADLPDNPDSLPDWLKPPDKPSSTSEGEAQTEPPFQSETPETETPDREEIEAPEEREEIEESEADDAAEPSDDASEEIWETLDDLNDPDISDFSQTSKPDGENILQPLSLGQTALIGPMPVAAPQARRGFSFFGFVKMLVFLALIAATAGNSYLLLRQNPELQLLIPVQMVEPAKIGVREAGFEKLSPEPGAPIVVKAIFANGGKQDGILSDFDILLKDAAGTVVMRWRVESHGQIIAAGQQHSISSTLFSPPQNLASVALAYPAR